MIFSKGKVIETGKNDGWFIQEWRNSISLQSWISSRQCILVILYNDSISLKFFYSWSCFVWVSEYPPFLNVMEWEIAQFFEIFYWPLTPPFFLFLNWLFWACIFPRYFPNLYLDLITFYLIQFCMIWKSTSHRSFQELKVALV